jgi:hypothetical protein
MTESKTTRDLGPWGRLARDISEISNPLFVALPTFLVIALASAPNVLQALLWWIVAVAGISVTPYLFVRRGVRKGRYSDHHVSKREQRFVPLVLGTTATAIAFVLLIALHASRVLIATMIAVIVVLIIATAITHYWKWKISLHLVGVAGAVTVVVLTFGPLWLLLSPLVAMVAWARWKVGAHTLLQAVAGMVLAVGATVFIFWGAGVL